MTLIWSLDIRLVNKRLAHA